MYLGGAFSVTVIVVGIGISDPSSNPLCVSFCANALGKCMNPSLFLRVMSKKKTD